MEIVYSNKAKVQETKMSNITQQHTNAIIKFESIKVDVIVFNLENYTSW